MMAITRHVSVADIMVPPDILAVNYNYYVYVHCTHKVQVFTVLMFLLEACMHIVYL